MQTVAGVLLTYLLLCRGLGSSLAVRRCRRDLTLAGVGDVRVLGAIGVAMAMLAHLQQRLDTIAIMKSLGMREYSVRRIFILESMMMGSVGILFGWLLGYLLCYAWSLITIFNPLTGATVPLQIYYSPMHYIASGAVAILCCSVAAFFPARKATRVHPVEIIRGAS